MIDKTFGAERTCSFEHALRTADTTPVWAAFSSITGVTTTGVMPVQYQGITVSGASLQGSDLPDPAFIAVVTDRVRKGVPAGTTTSSSPPV